MHYTAIIKDGGLFIPNVFADIDDDHAHVVQVEVDMASVRQQLDTDDALKAVAKAPKKTTKRPVKRVPPAPLVADTSHQEAAREKALDELEALDDSELSEMLKAYINDGQGSAQIALDNL